MKAVVRSFFAILVVGLTALARIMHEGQPGSGDGAESG